MARKSIQEHSMPKQIEDYFRCNVFIPFMDLAISQLESRFSSHFQAASRLMYIIPSKCLDSSEL
jgi:hypothetical protein